MVLLIGGSSRVGKTLLAQRLMETHAYPYLSLDHLKMGLIRAGITRLTAEDDYEMRYYLWPIVAEMVKTAVENRQNLIIEGCYIPEEWRSSFTECHLSQIRCVFVVMSEGYLRAHFDAVKEYADAIEKRRDDRPDLERLISCSRSFREACIRCGTPYIEIDSRFDLDALTEEAERKLGLAGRGQCPQPCFCTRCAQRDVENRR